MNCIHTRVKVAINTFSHCYKQILLQINGVPSNLLFIKEPRKKYHNFFHKTLSSTTVFNFDNNQRCFLSIKSAY